MAPPAHETATRSDQETHERMLRLLASLYPLTFKEIKEKARAGPAATVKEITELVIFEFGFICDKAQTYLMNRLDTVKPCDRAEIVAICDNRGRAGKDKDTVKVNQKSTPNNMDRLVNAEATRERLRRRLQEKNANK